MRAKGLRAFKDFYTNTSIYLYCLRLIRLQCPLALTVTVQCSAVLNSTTGTVSVSTSIRTYGPVVPTQEDKNSLLSLRSFWMIPALPCPALPPPLPSLSRDKCPKSLQVKLPKINLRKSLSSSLAKKEGEREKKRCRSRASC